METNKHSTWPTPEQAAEVLAQGERDDAALEIWRVGRASTARVVSAEEREADNRIARGAKPTLSEDVIAACLAHDDDAECPACSASNERDEAAL